MKTLGLLFGFRFWVWTEILSSFWTFCNQTNRWLKKNWAASCRKREQNKSAWKTKLKQTPWQPLTLQCFPAEINSSAILPCQRNTPKWRVQLRHRRECLCLFLFRQESRGSFSWLASWCPLLLPAPPWTCCDPWRFRQMRPSCLQQFLFFYFSVSVTAATHRNQDRSDHKYCKFSLGLQIFPVNQNVHQLCCRQNNIPGVNGINNSNGCLLCGNIRTNLKKTIGRSAAQRQRRNVAPCKVSNAALRHFGANVFRAQNIADKLVFPLLNLNELWSWSEDRPSPVEHHPLPPTVA